ncbi:MAG: SIMPL domain-containing protein [Phycisphaerae bacterium]|nr:SIMPL domain-containing protein [Phycisphaerae bacterium]
MRVRIAGSAAFVVAIIGLSAIVSTVVAGRAYENRGRQTASRDQEVTVRGSARQRVVADLATWSITLRAQGESLPAAFSSIETAAERVRNFLAESGFGDQNLQLSPIDTATHFERDEKGNTTRKVSGYTLTRVFSVSTPDVRRVTRASGEVTRLLKEGLEVASASPQYLISGLSDVRVSMMGDAAKDARSRAEEIAGKSGCSLGEVRRVSAGPFQVTVPNSTEVSGGGSYDTTTVEKDVSVTVSVSFGIRS